MRATDVNDGDDIQSGAIEADDTETDDTETDLLIRAQDPKVMSMAGAKTVTTATGAKTPRAAKRASKARD